VITGRHPWKRIWLIGGLVLALGLSLRSFEATAMTISVSPGADHLRQAIANAAPGDVLHLNSGIHSGPVMIDKPISLIGEKGAVVKGSGEGSTITVAAPDVIVRGLTVTGSGRAIRTMDAGIFVNKSGHRALVEGNHLKENLFGVYFWGPNDAVMRNNVVIGLQTRHVNRRGNGVSLWNTPGSIVENNDFRFGRDGIFSTSSRKNIFKNNRFRDVRIAIHYMYTNSSEISGNISKGNHVGFALMFSKKLIVRGNRSINDRDHGILLNYTNSSVIEENRVEKGKTKCVFIYNSNKNIFLRNQFKNCGIGIHFTAGSERNVISGNAFIANRTQVKYVGSRNLDWSHKGQGNYWSDNPAFDLDGDGLSDAAYRPNDIVDRVVWAHPTAKLLLNSPAVQILRWAQSRFPSLLPGGVVDTAPLMTVPNLKFSDDGGVRP
jgi:nitrous oxidase accessory protein